MIASAVAPSSGISAAPMEAPIACECRRPDLALEAPDKAQSNRVSGISVDIVAKYSELIPAEPSEEIAGTSDCPKAPRNRLQDPIPSG